MKSRFSIVFLVLCLPFMAFARGDFGLVTGTYKLTGVTCTERNGDKVAFAAGHFESDYNARLKIEGPTDHSIYSFRSNYNGVVGSPCDINFKGEYFTKGQTIVLAPLSSSFNRRVEGNTSECHQLPWEKNSTFNYDSQDGGAVLILSGLDQSQTCAIRPMPIELRFTRMK